MTALIYLNETKTHIKFDGSVVDFKDKFTKMDYENGFIKAFYYYKVLKREHTRAKKVYRYTRSFMDKELCKRLEKQIRLFHKYIIDGGDKPRVNKSVLRLFDINRHGEFKRKQSLEDLVEGTDHLQYDVAEEGV